MNNPHNQGPEDPVRLWREQTTEPSPMTLEIIRFRNEQLERQTRRETFGNALATAIVQPTPEINQPR